jgi:hypothetical protein
MHLTPRIFNALLRDTSEEGLRALQGRDFDILTLSFTDELTPLLLRLPLLECVKARLSYCRFDFLTALPRLTQLELDVPVIKEDAWSTLLAIFASNGVASLRMRALRGGLCSSDDLTLLLSHTPPLTSLTLGELAAVHSLSFFRQLPKLAETLTQLTIVCQYSCLLTATDLLSLTMHKQWRQLRLLNWPLEEFHRLSAEDRAPFEQRPSAVLPQLEVFEWTGRNPFD